ncbi:MAG: DUF1573 domain-containing protein [Chitinophagales bacterium]|nr:DUF1573 domain-containing protein [Chitinophagales bacterium]
MKLFTAIAILLSISIGCQQKKSSPGLNENAINDTRFISNPSKISFQDTLINLGTIKEGEVKKLSFKFTNSGDQDLVIMDAKGSCGCTVANYPKEVFKPNTSGEITAEFNSKNRLGKNRKAISVYTNTFPPESRLFFDVEVVK